MRQFSEVRGGLVRLGQLMRRESFVQDFAAPDDENVVIAVDGASFAWPVVGNQNPTTTTTMPTATPKYPTISSGSAQGAASADGTTTLGAASADAAGVVQDAACDNCTVQGATNAGGTVATSGTSEAPRSSADVVRGLRLAVKRGELLGVCGRVGSGKSAVITALLGQMRCTTPVSGLVGEALSQL